MADEFWYAGNKDPVAHRYRVPTDREKRESGMGDWERPSHVSHCGRYWMDGRGASGDLAPNGMRRCKACEGHPRRLAGTTLDPTAAVIRHLGPTGEVGGRQSENGRLREQTMNRDPKFRRLGKALDVLQKARGKEMRTSQMSPDHHPFSVGDRVRYSDGNGWHHHATGTITGIHHEDPANHPAGHYPEGMRNSDGANYGKPWVGVSVANDPDEHGGTSLSGFSIGHVIGGARVHEHRTAGMRGTKTLPAAPKPDHGLEFRQSRSGPIHSFNRTPEPRGSVHVRGSLPGSFPVGRVEISGDKYKGGETFHAFVRHHVNRPYAERHKPNYEEVAVGSHPSINHALHAINDARRDKPITKTLEKRRVLRMHAPLHLKDKKPRNYDADRAKRFKLTSAGSPAWIIAEEAEEKEPKMHKALDVLEKDARRCGKAVCYYTDKDSVHNAGPHAVEGAGKWHDGPCEHTIDWHGQRLGGATCVQTSGHSGPCNPKPQGLPDYKRRRLAGTAPTRSNGRWSNEESRDYWRGYAGTSFGRKGGIGHKVEGTHLKDAANRKFRKAADVLAEAEWRPRVEAEIKKAADAVAGAADPATKRGRPPTRTGGSKPGQIVHRSQTGYEVVASGREHPIPGGQHFEVHPVGRKDKVGEIYANPIGRAGETGIHLQPFAISHDGVNLGEHDGFDAAVQAIAQAFEQSQGAKRAGDAVRGAQDAVYGRVRQALGGQGKDGAKKPAGGKDGGKKPDPKGPAGGGGKKLPKKADKSKGGDKPSSVKPEKKADKPAAKKPLKKAANKCQAHLFEGTTLGREFTIAPKQEGDAFAPCDRDGTLTVEAGKGRGKQTFRMCSDHARLMERLTPGDWHRFREKAIATGSKGVASAERGAKVARKHFGAPMADRGHDNARFRKLADVVDEKKN